MQITKEKLLNDKQYFVPISYDEVFERCFANIDNTNNTVYLASVLLDMPYEVIKGHIRFANPKQNDARIIDKNGRKDLTFYLELKNMQKITIELNIRKYGIQVIIDRNLYYASNYFGSGLKKNENYNKIIPLTQFNLNNFDIDKKSNKAIRTFYMQDADGVLSDKFKIVYFNIERARKIWYNKDVWKYNQKEAKKIYLGALIMANKKRYFYKILDEMDAPDEVKKSIKEIVEDMNDNEEFRAFYFDREEEEARIRRSMIAQLKEDLLKEAQEKEEKKMNAKLKKETKKMDAKLKKEKLSIQKDIVKNMINNNMDIKEIAKVAGMSEEVVRELLED